MKRTIYWIGIDPGVKTGFALWDSERNELMQVETMKIHNAMDAVMDYAKKGEVVVRFEDARLRKWFGKAGREQLQGAGSVKRDCGIWEDFLTWHKIPYEAVSPMQKGAKWDDGVFRRLTKWEGRTSEHGRDAAKLVFGMKNNDIKACLI
jgi:hypothetical protein